MNDFPWLSFLLLVCVALGLGQAMNWLHRWLTTCRSEDDDEVIGHEAQAAVDVALDHWKQVQKHGDEH